MPVAFVVVVVGRGLRTRRVRDDLDRSLQDSPCREQRLRGLLQPVGAAAHDDDFEASLRVEVDVHGRPNLVSELVLHFGDSFGEFPNMVVIDDGHARERVDSLARQGPDDLGAREVADQLRSTARALFHELVELSQQ